MKKEIEGPKLPKAADWFNKALKMEEEGKTSMMNKALEMSVKIEAEGVAVGERWTK